jgi:predicted transcriptional regulator
MGKKDEKIMTTKEKIKSKGIKISWIADKVGVSQPLLSMYLSGARTMPTDIKEKIELLLV